MLPQLEEKLLKRPTQNVTSTQDKKMFSLILLANSSRSFSRNQIFMSLLS